MSAQGDVTRWASDLTDPPESFQSQVSAIESTYQTVWQSFQTAIHDLSQVASGPDAFSGQAAKAISDAFNECVSAEQNFQHMDFMSHAANACHDCAQSIQSAITDTSSSMSDPIVLWEALKIMDPGDIAQYGSEMVPDWLEWVNGITASSLPKDTIHALNSLATQIKTAVTAWNDAISSLNNESWPKIAEWYESGRTIIETGGKLSETIDKFLEDTKGEYILAGVGMLLGMMTGDEKPSWKNLDSDLIGTGLSLLPGVDAVAFGGSVVKTGGSALAWGQNKYAQSYSQSDPDLAHELADPAEGIKKGSENVNVQGVLNDVGGMVYDLTWGSTGSSGGSSTFSDSASHTPLRALDDLQKAVVDTGSTVKGAYKVGVDTVGSLVEDGLAQHGDKVIIPKINKFLHWIGG